MHLVFVRPVKQMSPRHTRRSRGQMSPSSRVEPRAGQLQDGDCGCVLQGEDCVPSSQLISLVPQRLGVHEPWSFPMWMVVPEQGGDRRGGGGDTVAPRHRARRGRFGWCVQLGRAAIRMIRCLKIDKSLFEPTTTYVKHM